MNNENIFLTKINAFRKKIWETNDSQNLEILSAGLDDIVASLPTSDEAGYFKALHDFFCQLLDKRLFEKKHFMNKIFRKLLNLYAYYLDNDSLAVCSVVVCGILGNDTFCNVNDILNLLNYQQKINKIDLPIFPILENDECCDNLYEIFCATENIINENPYLIFYSVADLRKRLEESVYAAIENYENIQIIMHEDSLGIGALLLLSQFSDKILDDYRLTCVVPDGVLTKCKRWFDIPANRNWLGKKSKFHHDAKKIFKHIKDKPAAKKAPLFYLSAKKHQKFPDLPELQTNKVAGIFLLLDSFEPVLPDFSFYNGTWANWDNPNFLRYKDTDRFVTLGCVILKDDSENKTISWMEFYKSLRGIKDESTVLEMWKKASLQEPEKSSEFLIKADVLCRAGQFAESFSLVKKYYEAKITAAYRICNSIVRHCKKPNLCKKVSDFINEKELFQKAFCAELHEVVDSTEDDKKTYWL